MKKKKKTYDFAVIGAGVFGTWTAHYLRRSGASVALLDAHGPGNSRSSSGGETRIIRAGYGGDELYASWAIRSFALWQDLFARIRCDLFRPTGVLWLGDVQDPHLSRMQPLLARLNVPCEQLDAAELRQRYPQLSFDTVTLGVLEPRSGVLLARRALQALATEVERSGVDLLTADILAPRGSGRLAAIETSAGQSIAAGTFVFACGAWLPKLFPDVLAGRIFSTRQEVFFLGPPAGSEAFRLGNMPAWLHHSHPERPYALPDIENRGLKIAFDCHGPEFDPETGARFVSRAGTERMRAYLNDHIPELARAPVIETRVCQYENTWNGDFLIDLHPGHDNVWLAGGGSGHGFKHGPAVGEHASARILSGLPPEPRFSLAVKQNRQDRAVY
jgi:monomeric sarcosine oxidase